MTVVMTQLDRDAAELAERTGLHGEVHRGEGTQLLVILQSVPLPGGTYAVDTSDVLFLADAQYPLSAMDMFWTDPAVVLASGSVPNAADQIETYGDRQWRRFSWHRNGVWRPHGNPLLDHFEFMQARLAMDAAS